MDYRRITSKTRTLCVSASQAIFQTLANVLANNYAVRVAVISRNDDVQLAFTNWSIFAQDTWKLTRSLTVTYGLRWEYNAAPSSPERHSSVYGNPGRTIFATMTLAPQGTPLWHPQKDNFAPRLGVAWQARPNLVLRAGAGIFYDLGYADVADGSGTWPYAQQNVFNELDISAERRQCRAASFLHDSARRVSWPS